MECGKVDVTIRESVKTAQVQSEIEWTRDSARTGHIANHEPDVDACLVRLAFRHLNGPRSKINTSDLPTVFGESDCIGPRTAAQVDGSPSRVFRNEIQKLRRRDAVVPRWTK